MKRSVLFVLLAVLAIATVGYAQAAQESVDQTATAPKLVKAVRPEPVEYSPGRLIEGFVTLEIRVATDGTVKGANILYRTSSWAVPSAIAAVEHWKFEPATVQGKPVEAVVVYSLPFGSNDLPIFAADNYPTRLLLTEQDGSRTEQMLYSVK